MFLKTRFTLVVIILSLGCAFTSNAQPNPGVTDAIRASITDKVNALFGAGMYDPNTIDIVNVDSSITPNESLGIQDPYHTLEHCYVFLALGKMQSDGSFPKGIVGVYKNGNIIWHSPPIIKSDGVSNADIKIILDMNRTGKVDIVTYWEEGMEGGYDYIWIFSWDGHQGTPLNLYDSAGHSNLMSYTDDVQYVDFKGDGVLEIEGQWHDQGSPRRVYSTLYAWNGKNYVSIDTLTFASVHNLPRDRFKASVQAAVTGANDSLYFSYIIQNRKGSLQKIETFAVARGTKSISYVSGPTEWGFDVWTKQLLLSWDDEFLYNLLSQGSSDTFEFSSTALPQIESFYIQGYNTTGTLSDIFTNSFRGYTLAPADPPSPFFSLDFLDTLISYKHQSVPLGWLKDDKTCKPDCDEIMNGRGWYSEGDFQQYDKWNPDNTWNFDRDWNNGIVEVLDARLIKAGVELSKKDSVDARQDLEIFVMEVEVLNDVSKKLEDSKQAPIMTSEAYALLKYNAEYLIDSLPAGRQKQ